MLCEAAEAAPDSAGAMRSLWAALVDVIGRREVSEMPYDPTALLRRAQHDAERYQDRKLHI